MSTLDHVVVMSCTSVTRYFAAFGLKVCIHSCSFMDNIPILSDALILEHIIKMYLWCPGLICGLIKNYSWLSHTSFSKNYP